MIINIPSSAFDIQIVKKHRSWYLKYKNEERTCFVYVNQPCDIKNISKDDDKHCVEVNLYTIKEYKSL